jgi:hypothetical protein
VERRLTFGKGTKEAQKRHRRKTNNKSGNEVLLPFFIPFLIGDLTKKVNKNKR